MTNILNVPKPRHGPQRYKDKTKKNVSSSFSSSATKSTAGGKGDRDRHHHNSVIGDGVERDSDRIGGGGTTASSDHWQHQNQIALKSVLKRNTTSSTKDGGNMSNSGKSNNKHDEFDFRTTSSTSTKSKSPPPPALPPPSSSSFPATESTPTIRSNKNSSNNHGITRQGGVVGHAGGGGGRRRGRKRRSSTVGGSGSGSGDIITTTADFVDRQEQKQLHKQHQQPIATTATTTTKEQPLQSNRKLRKVSTVKSSRHTTTAPSSLQTQQESRKLFHQELDDEEDDENFIGNGKMNVRHQTPKRRKVVPTGTDIEYAESSSSVEQPQLQKDENDLLMTTTTGPSPPSSSTVMTNQRTTNNTNRYAVAIDTRFMNTAEGRTSFDEFRTSVSKFLYSTSVHRQGQGSLSVLPVGVAWTTSSLFSSSSSPSSSSLLAVDTSPSSRLTGSTKVSLTTERKKKQQIRTFRSSSALSQSSKQSNQYHTNIGRGIGSGSGHRLRPTEKSSVVVQYESTSSISNAKISTTTSAASSSGDQSTQTEKTTIIQDNIRRIAYEFLQSGSVSGDNGSTNTVTGPATTETNSSTVQIATALAPASSSSNQVAVGSSTTGEGTVGYDVGAAAVPISPSMKYNNNKKVLSLPKAMMAHATWEYYGDLVESIVRNNPRMPDMGPLNVLILASDTAALLDMTESSHKYGIDKFWKRIKRNFERDQIHSIELIVVKSNKTVVAHKLVGQDDLSCQKMEPDQRQHQHHEKDMDSFEEMTNGESPGKVPAIKDPQDAETEEPVEPKEGREIRQDSAMASLSISDMKSDRIENIDDLLRKLKEHLRMKSQNDFRRGRSAMQFDKQIATQVDVSISSMNNNRIYFQNIIHQWVRQSLGAVCTRIDCPLPQTVRLQLHETPAYDVSYKYVPCLDTESSNLERFLLDLKLLSQARLKIEQIVPIESIDSSLLFGVPIGVQAGIDGNKDEYAENMDVVRALFKQLAERDCALLILSTGPDEEDKTVTSKGPQQGLFHCNYQHFVLLPELESNSSGMSPCQGVMYRLANSENSFQVRNDLAITNSDGESTNDSIAYVEDFLESLSCAPINPMMLSRPIDLRMPLGGYRGKSKNVGKKSVTWEEPSAQRSSLEGHSQTKNPPRSIIDHRENNERNIDDDDDDDDDDDKDVQMPSTEDVEDEERNNEAGGQSLLPGIKDSFELSQEQYMVADSTQADNSDNDSIFSSHRLLETSKISATTSKMKKLDNDGVSKRNDAIDSKKPDDDVLIDSDTESDTSKNRRAYLIDFPQKRMDNDEDSEAEWKDSDEDIVANKSSRKFRKLNTNSKQRTGNKKPRKGRPKEILPATKSNSTKNNNRKTIDDLTENHFGSGVGGVDKNNSDETVEFDESSCDSDDDSDSSTSSSSTSDTSSTDSDSSDNSSLSGTGFKYGH